MFEHLINSEDISRLFDTLHYNLPLLLKENGKLKANLDETKVTVKTLKE